VGTQSHSASWPTAKVVAVAVFGLTVTQLAVAAFVPGLEQFDGKGFAARLFAYPLMMLIAPVGFTVWARRRSPRPSQPWGAYTCIWVPFLIDVTGNTLDLYDSVSWWDDANHLVNWFLMSVGVGLILTRSTLTQAWALLWLTAGFGALLAGLVVAGRHRTLTRAA
jgi:hypothetical protein